MKKSLLVLLLAVALVMPIFAATKNSEVVSNESKFDIVGKIGLTVVPTVNAQTDDYDYKIGDNANNSVLLAIEGLYKLDKKISVGLGISYMFAANFDTSFDYKWTWYSGDNKMSVGFSNIYATVKPKLSDSIYAIAQLGWGIPNFKFDIDDDYYKSLYDITKGGIYAGLGAGVEYKSFLFEVLYTINNATLKSTYDNEDYPVQNVFRYSAISFNLGYKFSL